MRWPVACVNGASIRATSSFAAPAARTLTSAAFASGAVVDVPAEPLLDAVSLLERVLTNIRVLTERQGRSIESTRIRLWATELTLLLPHHPVELRRERGELLARLGDFVQAGQVLADYAALIESVDEQGAEQALRQAQQARARLN